MNKRLFLFIILNMVVLLGCIGLGIYAHAQARRHFPSDVVYVAPRLNESHLHFDISDINNLAWFNPHFTFTGESRGSVLVASSTQQVVTTVIYTDIPYFNKNFLDFIEGGVWADSYGENAIILNDALGWRLFGSVYDITGLPVFIGDRTFVVAGVIRQNDRRYISWMPRTAPGAPVLPVTALYILPNSPNPLAFNQARDMISRNLNRSVANYSIVDINRLVESINIQQDFFVYRLDMYLGLLIALCMGPGAQGK